VNELLAAENVPPTDIHRLIKWFMEICRRLLLRYEREGDEFSCSIVIWGESWVHHFEPGNSSQWIAVTKDRQH
jgi:hypothetical protein